MKSYLRVVNSKHQRIEVDFTSSVILHFVSPCAYPTPASSARVLCSPRIALDRETLVPLLPGVVAAWRKRAAEGGVTFFFLHTLIKFGHISFSISIIPLGFI